MRSALLLFLAYAWNAATVSSWLRRPASHRARHIVLLRPVAHERCKDRIHVSDTIISAPHGDPVARGGLQRLHNRLHRSMKEFASQFLR